jgi:endonuclease YncB( thermonuclease family)/DNA uptake protein ComE-like DNA-binding protein
MSHGLLRRVLLLVAGLLALAERGAAEWAEFEGCRLVANDSNDGDSFHVEHKDRTYVFRLYFVDAPETSELIPDRVREQAEAFDTTKEEVLAAGKDAADFTRKLLRKNFRVVTRWEDARGMTKGGRHYAFVETAEGEDLGELLVAAGWARSFGMKATTDSRSAGQWQQRYDRLEQKARRAGAGIWGDGKGAAVDLEEEGSGDDSGEAEESEEGLTGGLMDAALDATTLSSRSASDGEKAASTPRPSPSPRPAVAKASPSPVRPAKTKTGKEKLDLNKATKEELVALPGIDETKAAAIIAARPLAGSYDLLRVPGIGPSTLKEIYPHIKE